jgi:hypothetical protein
MWRAWIAPFHFVITRLVRVIHPKVAPQQPRTGFGLDGPHKAGHDD